MRRTICSPSSRPGGYKVVHVVGKGRRPSRSRNTSEIVRKEMGGGLETARPMSSVIKTIQGN